jgi:uncharacterized delta-60 repeat protein
MCGPNQAACGLVMIPTCGHNPGMITRVWGLAAVVFAVVALAAVPALAAPGDLDPTFGQGGHVRVQANARCLRGCVEFGGSYADAVALRPDGGIVMGGYNSYIGAGWGGPSSAESVPGALVRLSPNGALDTSFGRGGIADTPLRVEQIATNAIGGLAVLGGDEREPLGLARYTGTGVLDGPFASQGVRWLAQPGSAPEVQRDAQGRIVALGSVSRIQIDVVRYLRSGALDTSFGHGGYVRLRLPETPREAATPPARLVPPEVTPMALATLRSGGVIVAFATASSTAEGYGRQHCFLERLTPGGRVDRGFGRRGIVRLSGGVSKMAVAPNGHVLLASAEPARVLPGSYEPRAAGKRLVLADYTSTGRPDRSFGTDGVAHSQRIAGNRTGIEPNAIAFDAAGDAIVVGELPVRTIDTPNGTGFLARYTPDGLDCSFGTGGVVIDSEVGGASAVAVQPNGRIVVAGWSRKAFMAARYMGGGTPRTCPRDPRRWVHRAG